MNDITKLPRWAQNEIERLRANIKAMELDMAAIVGATPSGIEADPNRVYRGDEVPRLFLPEHFTVAFAVGDGRMHVSLKDGALSISGQHPNVSRIAVLPSHANAIDVQFEKDTI